MATYNEPSATDLQVQPPADNNSSGGSKMGKKFLMLLLIVAVGAGVWYWQQQKVNDLNNLKATEESQLNDAAKKISELEEPFQFYKDSRVIGTASDSEGNVLTKNLTAFYNLVMEQQDKNGDCPSEFCEQYRPFLMDSAIKQLQKGGPRSLVSCSQMKVLAYFLGKPKIQGAAATVTVTKLPAGEGLQSARADVVNLMKHEGEWMIAGFNCSP